MSRKTLPGLPGSIHTIVFFLALLLLVPAMIRPAQAGIFKVTPIRLDFSGSTRTGLVAVHAEGPGRLNIQMKAYEWTQDEEGKDVYTETNDLIFFPRMATIEAGAERTIRAGMRGELPAIEKTYRLFIEEIPERRPEAGANVAMAIRFGLPIFVAPKAEAPAAEITGAWITGGSAGVTVKNTGNVHLVVTSVEMTGTGADGSEVFSQRLGGWYLLSGVSRPYSATIPEENCAEVKKLRIEVLTDRLNLETSVEAGPGACTPETL